ncbi:hypothetical protein L9F63_028291, partial [Diploptera punctata]
ATTVATEVAAADMVALALCTCRLNKCDCYCDGGCRRSGRDRRRRRLQLQLLIWRALAWNEQLLVMEAVDAVAVIESEVAAANSGHVACTFVVYWNANFG